MSAQALSVPPGGPSITVRRAKIEDAPVCGRVCYDAFYKISTDHGFPPDFPSPEVAVAETNLDLQALIASAEAFAGPGIIVPTRNSSLFRWCLEQPSSRPANDADELRTVQRAGRGISAFRALLKR